MYLLFVYLDVLTLVLAVSIGIQYRTSLSTLFTKPTTGALRDWDADRILSILPLLKRERLRNSAALPVLGCGNLN